MPFQNVPESDWPHLLPEMKKQSRLFWVAIGIATLSLVVSVVALVR